MRRRHAPKILLAVAMSAVLVGCTSSPDNGGGGGSGAPKGDPIKIAIIPPSSGTFAELGNDLKKGWEYAVEEANKNGGIDGHPVELIVKDTDATAGTTVRAMSEAVNQGGAQFISGVMTSPEHVAVFQQATSLGVVAINHVGQADSLVGAACAPNAFTTVQSTGVNIMAMQKALKDIPGKKWAFLNADFATGHDVDTAFKAAVEAQGGTVVSEQFVPVGTADFGSYISKIKESGADALLSTVYGSDLVAFVNQSQQFNLSSSVKTVLGISSITENLFPTIGTKVDGWYGNVIYDVNADNAANQAFVKGYTAKYGKAPYYFPANAYIAAQMLFAGIKKAQSIDPMKVRDALSGLTFSSLNGEVTMRAQDHRLLSPVFAGQVSNANGSTAWKTILKVPASDITPPVDTQCKL